MSCRRKYSSSRSREVSPDDRGCRFSVVLSGIRVLITVSDDSSGFVSSLHLFPEHLCESKFYGGVRGPVREG